MENPFYNIFEGDQVLTAKNLNDLRSYLDEQDRLTRTHLSGIGIVCGLEVEMPGSETNTIKISAGVGITSRGYLASFPGASCTHIRSYTDPGTIEPAPGETEAGVYSPFKDGEDEQIKLWELIEINEEEGEGPAPDMFEINRGEAGTVINEESGESINFSNYCVLLYLEMNDEDLEDCFGDDCDENGVQRTLTWRKLLITEADLEDINEALPDESTYVDAVSASQGLDDPYVERLGYFDDEDLALWDYTNNENTPQLLYSSFEKLSNDYHKIIEKASVRVGKALHKSYDAFKPVLSSMYATQPFPGFDNETSIENGLLKRITREIRFKPAAIQYAYDFLKDLVEAYDEFREAACEVAALCRPNKEFFPRHLMLGYLGDTKEGNMRSAYRHYFRPSPILDGQGDLKSRFRHLHRRLVIMIEQFEVDTEEDDEIRITPSKSAADPLSNRAIPYYYNVDEAAALLRLWNYQKTRLNKFELIPSYHAGEYAGRSQIEAAMRKYDKHSFLRIEGHVGRNYETVLGEIKEKQNHLNMPIKVVGVKLSKTFQNTNVSYECRFEDLQELYETFKTELQCLLDEQMKFFRGLEVKEETVEGEERVVAGDERTLKMADKDYYAIRGGKEFVYNSPFTGKRRYSPQSNPKTLGYTYDRIAEKEEEGERALNTVYLNPAVYNIAPAIWINFFQPFIRLAGDIQRLFKLLPKRLEDIEMDGIEAAYDRVIQTAEEYKKQLKGSEENQEQLEGKEQIIIYRLDKLIYSCSIKKLKELYRIYRDRVQKAQEMNLFSNFAERHSGMEHMGGVPKGGTFVLAYIDRNEESLGSDVQVVRPSRAAMPEANMTNLERVRRISGRTGIRERQQFTLGGKKEINSQVKILLKELRHVSVEQDINIDAEKWNALDKSIADKIGRLPEAEVDERPPDNVVVADFALPYLCKSDCPELATMVISQLSFSLPKNQFCKKDETKYPFTIHPEGGVVESKAGGITQEGGQWFFNPSQVTTQGEDVQFTYRVNNQTVVYNAKVFNPQSHFSFESKQLDNGNTEVVFFNSSKDAQRFEWAFGDGTASTAREPVHVYREYEKEQAIVTLKAYQGECSDQMNKKIQIPQEVETEFDLQKSKQFDKYTYCNSDNQSYVFKTKPAGKELTGDDISGIQQQNEQYFFTPRGYTAGSYTFKYRDESIEVKILQGPQNVDVKSEILEQGPGFTTVRFHYSGESETDQLLWMIDGKSYGDVESLERTFKKQGGRTHQVILHVIAENGCKTEISDTIEIPFKEEQPDISGPVITDVDDAIWNADRLRDPVLDNSLFNEGNHILNKSRNYLTNLKAKFQNEDNRRKFKEGEMNLDIAKKYEPMLKDASDIIKTKATQASGDEKEYMARLYEQQLEQLLNLAGRQNKDIRSNSKMGQLLKSAENQVKGMREAGVEIDKQKTLSKSVNKSITEARRSNKKYFSELLHELKNTLNQ